MINFFRRKDNYTYREKSGIISKMKLNNCILIFNPMINYQQIVDKTYIFIYHKHKFINL